MSHLNVIESQVCICVKLFCLGYYITLKRFFFTFGIDICFFVTKIKLKNDFSIKLYMETRNETGKIGVHPGYR